MIDLKSNNWSELQSGFGNGEIIPSLLKELTQFNSTSFSPTEEPWFSLWSGLCHQGDIYTASYAALPHIVDILSKSTPRIDFNFFLLPASIEFARLKGNGPELPKELEGDYIQAIQKLKKFIGEHLFEKCDINITKSIIFAIAVLMNQLDLAKKLDELYDND